MMIKVFNFNADGKIEFTKQELETLLNEIYEEGKSDGSQTITWSASPYLGPTCTAVLPVTEKFEQEATDHTCCGDRACNCNEEEHNKCNCHSIETSICNFDVNAAKKMVNDVFSALAKELNF